MRKLNYSVGVTAVAYVAGILWFSKHPEQFFALAPNHGKTMIVGAAAVGVLLLGALYFLAELNAQTHHSNKKAQPQG